MWIFHSIISGNLLAENSLSTDILREQKKIKQRNKKETHIDSIEFSADHLIWLRLNNRYVCLCVLYVIP